MTIWLGILLGSLAVYSWKVLGAMLPTSALNHPVVSRLASLITVALLAALVGVQGFTTSSDSVSSVVFDARVPAILVAVGLLALRAPFIVVVAASAAVAALLRAFL